LIGSAASATASTLVAFSAACWDGSEVFSCDVGDENSDAVVKLNPVQITRGAPVRLNSFRLSMP
jgi:hypothetical protein